jgi:hypothetical protein
MEYRGGLSVILRFSRHSPLATRHSKLETRNWKLETRNSELDTRHSKLETRHFDRFSPRQVTFFQEPKGTVFVLYFKSSLFNFYIVFIFTTGFASRRPYLFSTAKKGRRKRPPVTKYLIVLNSNFYLQMRKNIRP